jgi:hypothetical protein
VEKKKKVMAPKKRSFNSNTDDTFQSGFTGNGPQTNVYKPLLAKVSNLSKTNWLIRILGERKHASDEETTAREVYNKTLLAISVKYVSLLIQF